MPELEEPIAEFEVSASGTLRVANFVEPKTRAGFYDYVAGFWSQSAKDLADAMEECEPLAWAVHSLYSEFRDELEAEIQDAQDEGGPGKRKLAGLKAQLAALPEEPEEGAASWLRSLADECFKESVVPEIDRWFAEEPDWGSEAGYLPNSGTAQGAALEFFRDMDEEELDALGVEIVEGEHPGSTYYAAELRGDVDDANAAAAAAGIPLQFMAAED